MSREQITVAVALMFGCGLCACSGPDQVGGGGKTGGEVAVKCEGFPESSRFITGKHPRYPRSRYIRAGAESCRSKEAAELAAKRKVAEQISSHIKGMFKSAQQQWATDTSAGSRFKYVQKIVSTTKVTTHFAHAQLIEIVERGAARGAHGAIAALNRKRAVTYLEPRLRKETDQFNKLVQQCHKAYAEGQLEILGDMAQKAAAAVPGLDKLLLEYCYIGGNPGHYNQKSPWLELARVHEMVSKLTHQRRWYVHVGATLAPASSSAALLEPEVANILRAKKVQADRFTGPVSGDALAAMKSKLGAENSCVSFAVVGNIRGRTSSMSAGDGARLHLCVCTLDLMGRHVGNGRTLFQLTVPEIKGGGASAARACQECVGLMKKPVRKALTDKLRALKL